MAFHRSIRSRRSPKKISSAFELQLTSMMDVLVIIVVFLLKSYSTTINTFSTVPGLQMPMSRSEDSPPESLQVIITPETVTFENEKILEFIQSASNLGTNEASYEFKKNDLDEEIAALFPSMTPYPRLKTKQKFFEQNPSTETHRATPSHLKASLQFKLTKKFAMTRFVR